MPLAPELPGKTMRQRSIFGLEALSEKVAKKNGSQCFETGQIGRATGNERRAGPGKQMNVWRESREGAREETPPTRLRMKREDAVTLAIPERISQCPTSTGEKP